MPLLNRFPDPELEEAYVRGERAIRRPAIRSLTMIAIVIFVLFSLFNPVFFPADQLVWYNVLAVAMIGSLVAAFRVVATDYYLRWRWLDPLIFVLLAIGAVLLTRPMASQMEMTGTTVLGLTIINVAVILVFAALTFIANTRWFLVWAAALTATFFVFLASQQLSLVTALYMAVNAGMFLCFAVFVNWSLDDRARAIFTAGRALAEEQAKTEDLLFNVLPEEVAGRLRTGEAVADSFSNVTVIFTDIVGFSVLAKNVSPGHLVELLNRFFSLADQCAARHGIEKVKTIGDAYLAVAGGTSSGGHGACEAVNFARDLIAELRALSKESGVDVQIRAGIHTGPVVGGVVGSQRLAYDYWGDTMNIASRIEGAATPGGIAVSAATYNQCNQAHDFGPAEIVALKGVGDIEIHRLTVQPSPK